MHLNFIWLELEALHFNVFYAHTQEKPKTFRFSTYETDNTIFWFFTCVSIFYINLLYIFLNHSRSTNKGKRKRLRTAYEN